MSSVRPRPSALPGGSAEWPRSLGPSRLGAARRRRTWRATPDDLVRWQRDGADFGASLEVAAQFGFAVVMDLTGKASENQLPMLLDY